MRKLLLKLFIGIIGIAGLSSSALAGYNVWGTDQTDGITFYQEAQSSGVPLAFYVKSAASTGGTASTAWPIVNWDVSAARERETGAIGLDYTFYVGRPAISFVGASTVTVGANMFVAGGPQSRTNATITSSVAMMSDTWESPTVSAYSAVFGIPGIEAGTGSVTDRVAIEVSDLNTVYFGNQTANVANIYGVKVPAVNIAGTALTRTITGNLAGIYTNAPTVGANVSYAGTPYGLFVDTGASRFDDQLIFGVGTAVTAGNYSVGRDADATNQWHANAPTGSSFEFSINDVAEMTLSATAANFQNNSISTTGGGSLTGTWSDLGTITTADINGGTLDGSVIGGASPAAATFTSLNATGGGALTGTWSDLGTITTVDINGGTIDGSVVGGATPAAGTFTALNATGGGALTGTWSNLGTVTTIDINGGTLDGVTIGGASAAAATITTLSMNNLITWSAGAAITAGSYQFGLDDSATTLHGNVATGGSYELSVNDVAELTLNATTLNLQTNTITGVGSAITGTAGTALTIAPADSTGTAAGTNITLKGGAASTSGAGGNVYLWPGAAAGANAPGTVQVYSSSSGTPVGQFTSSGVGIFSIQPTSGISNIEFSLSSAGSTYTSFNVSTVASAVNYLQVDGAITTAEPILSAQGSDTDIDIKVAPKGAGNFVPTASDDSALGSGTLMWSDLFLASGGVVDFNAGDITLTHGSNLLTLAGGDLTVSGAFTTTGTTTLATSLTGILRVDAGIVSIDSTLTATTAGTWTPTLTNVANLDTSTQFQCQYSRVGATVTGSCRFSADPTTTLTTTELGFSLPVASNFGAIEDAAGSCYASGIAAQGAAVIADTTNDRMEMIWKAVDTTDQPMTCSFSYQVI